ncbi:MAG: hypothetical protein EVA65_11390 [Oceanococcus sp.]|nr:MAG: hypothetical protein EVA65_11390 [Oceanococcus sp.]
MQTHYSNLLIKNGVAAMLVALVAGFLLIFSMIGGLSLSPVPVLFEFDMPGTTEGWRIVHLGMLLNGIMAIVLGVAMRAYVLSDGHARGIQWGTSIAVWGNFCFYIFGMFAPNHGVTLEANRLGEASFAGALAFFPALLGAVTLIYALCVLFRAEPAD